MRLLLLALVLAVAACSGARPPAPVLLRSAMPAVRLQALRADPSIPNWSSDEEIVAVCEAGPGETLMLTTHRVLTVRDGWARAPEARISGHETIQRQDGGLRLVGRTAIGSSSAAFSTGRCDVDAVEPLVAGVIRLRREGGTADALLAHHERIAERDRARAEAAARETARQAEALGAPAVPGLTWAHVPEIFVRHRALYEHFGVTPSDLLLLAQAYPNGVPNALCDDRPIGPVCESFLTVPHGGPCRAAALHYAAYYAPDIGREGVIRVECPEYDVEVGFSFGDVGVRQVHRRSGEAAYEGRGPLSLLE